MEQFMAHCEKFVLLWTKLIRSILIWTLKLKQASYNLSYWLFCFRLLFWICFLQKKWTRSIERGRLQPDYIPLAPLTRFTWLKYGCVVKKYLHNYAQYTTVFLREPDWIWHGLSISSLHPTGQCSLVFIGLPL